MIRRGYTTRSRPFLVNNKVEDYSLLLPAQPGLQTVTLHYWLSDSKITCSSRRKYVHSQPTKRFTTPHGQTSEKGMHESKSVAIRVGADKCLGDNHVSTTE